MADGGGISAFLQFVCVESLVTALVDMYPTIFRKKNRRETLILVVSILSYLVGLVMLTEVFWAQTTCTVLAEFESHPGRGGPAKWWGPCWGQVLAGEAHPAAQCLREAALPSERRSRFPFQPSPLVPVPKVLLPRLTIRALNSPYFGSGCIFMQAKPLQLQPVAW